ncbi:MAG: hypothetical protein KGL44_01745 [Sphingomonadales bacterium]|nr:hypothetical protein [Sphingomonadales bacterium]
MSFWTAIVIIVALAVFADVVKNKHRARQGLFHDAGGNDPALPAARLDPDAQRELDDLRERVRVLERIVTDERQSRSIAAEIESLRDK